MKEKSTSKNHVFKLTTVFCSLFLTVNLGNISGFLNLDGFFSCHYISYY